MLLCLSSQATDAGFQARSFKINTNKLQNNRFFFSFFFFINRRSKLDQVGMVWDYVLYICRFRTLLKYLSYFTSIHMGSGVAGVPIA